MTPNTHTWAINCIDMLPNRFDNRIRIRECIFMPTATRTTRSFSLERDVLKEVERTKGPVSTSERVNKLLKVGLEIERRQRLHAEAAEFFGGSGEDRTGRRAFQEASIKAITRE